MIHRNCAILYLRSIFCYKRKKSIWTHRFKQFTPIQWDFGRNFRQLLFFSFSFCCRLFLYFVLFVKLSENRNQAIQMISIEFIMCTGNSAYACFGSGKFWFDLFGYVTVVVNANNVAHSKQVSLWAIHTHNERRSFLRRQLSLAVCVCVHINILDSANRIFSFNQTIHMTPFIYTTENAGFFNVSFWYYSIKFNLKRKELIWFFALGLLCHIAPAHTYSLRLQAMDREKVKHKCRNSGSCCLRSITSVRLAYIQCLFKAIGFFCEVLV